VRRLLVGTYALIVGLHGLIHVMGVVEGYGGDVPQLTEPIGPAVGSLWLVAAALVFMSVGLLVVKNHLWWGVTAVAAVVSQVAILTSWTDAKTGTFVNVLMLLTAGYGYLSGGPPSYAREWTQRTTVALQQSKPVADTVLTEADLDNLPSPVAAWVRKSGAVGHPRVTNFYAAIHGRIRSGPDQPWMNFTGRQLNTFGQHPERLFWINATKGGLPVTVFHVLNDSGATMRGKVAALVSIVDAQGPEMDVSETVTFFNDLVVFAPATLVGAPVVWTPLAGDCVRATYTRGAISISADLFFSSEGDLVNFCSSDRWRAAADGKSFTRQPWNTPLTGLRDIRGRRVVSAGQALWTAPAPEGHFAYIEFFVDDLAYNVTSPSLPTWHPTAEDSTQEHSPEAPETTLSSPWLRMK
jgi:hypothetical protein